MNLQRFRKTASLMISFAMALTLLPARVSKVKASDVTPKVIYSNDFENASNLPVGKTAEDLVEVDSSKAVCYDVSFDPTSDWSGAGEVVIGYEYPNLISSGAKLQLDVYLPADSSYDGTIKFQGVTKLGDSWTWTQSDTIPEFSVTDFTLVEGFLKRTVEIPFADEIAANTGLHEIIVRLVGYRCTYSGKIYVDNLKLINGVGSPAEKKEYYYNDLEDPSKLPEFSDKISDAGLVSDINGSTALGINYAFDKNNGWDQGDMQFKIEYSDPIAAGAQLSFDLIFPKDAVYSGKISLKGATQMGPGWTWTEADSMQAVDVSKFTEVGEYKVQTITFTFGNQISVNQGLHAVCLQVVGNNCDYKGIYYIDNIKFTEGDEQSILDKYVIVTEKPKAQTKVEPDKLSILSTVSLVDAKASDKTVKLYAYLLGVGKSDYLIYGHQNDTIHKAGPPAGTTDGDFIFTDSDSKDLTGSYSGIEGIDTISLTGADYTVPEGSGDDLISYTVKLMEKAASEGSIIALAAHMPNFAEVVEKGKDSNGNYDYTGYSTDHTSGDVVQRVMPGGDLNEAFLGYMDMVADFANQMEAKNIPILFRPFHENTGSWFWWGAAQCDPAAFKNLWRYTVEYLRDVKDVHNFIYVYSPGSNFNNENDYLERYPGDDYVDVMAFDMYNNDPTMEDGFPDTLADTMRIVDGLAAKHNKLTAVAETGIAVTGQSGMGIVGNKRLNWHQDVSEAVAKTDAAYYMTWVNFGEGSGLYQPYLKTATIGHEMSNYFINYYNDETSVFADGIGDYTTISVVNTKAADNITGYMVTPYSGYRLLEGSTIKAIVKNAYQEEVNFVLKDSEGNIITTLEVNGSGSEYTADVTNDLLETIAPTFGSIELYIGGIVYDKINIFFNMKEEALDPAVVDTFESYNGNDALLGLKWATNAGSGCSVVPKTTNIADEHYKGNYGLSFNYRISTEKTSEGWAGITKAWTADWSAYDALQLWIRPDGYAQKLVIQIGSNGEDFEVWLPEFAGTTEAKLLTLPFEQFVGKNKGTFDSSKITKIGLWCNTIVPEGYTGPWTVDSTIYFDEIRAVNTKAVYITNIEDVAVNVEEGQAYTLPTTVSASYSDGSQKDVAITWEPTTADTSRAGTYIFKGTVDGYDKEVILTLFVRSVSSGNYEHIGDNKNNEENGNMEDTEYNDNSDNNGDSGIGSSESPADTGNEEKQENTSDEGNQGSNGGQEQINGDDTTPSVITDTETDKENSQEKLPQTGAIIDFQLLMSFGLIIIAAGVLLMNNKIRGRYLQGKSKN